MATTAKFMWCVFKPTVITFREILKFFHYHDLRLQARHDSIQ